MRHTERWLGWAAIVGLFFVYAGDAPPGVNEAHYLAKAKNFWDPAWCRNDLFVASGKAHAVYYWLFGWPTLFWSLSTTAWIGRFIGWGLLAGGLMRLCRQLRLPPFLAPVVAVVWIAGIQEGNLAGEWVIGGIEAKVPAYGLVLFGVSELLRRNWSATWLLFGSAAALHVLTGGWSVVAGTVAFIYLERFRRHGKSPPRRFFTPALFAGGAISLLGLLPAFAMSAGASPAEATSAARVYAYFRISHHLLPSAFHFDWYVRHAIITMMMFALMWLDYRTATPPRRRRIIAMGAFAAGAITISLVGLGVGMLPAVAPNLAAKLLRFYWFRLADAITPLALACSTAGLISQLITRQSSSDQSSLWLRLRDTARWDQLAAGSVASVLVFATAIWHVGLSTWQRVTDGVPISHSNRLLGLHSDADYWEQRKTMADWINVCRFVRANTGPDAVLLTPRHQQSFKWYAHRAEVVNWKDIPQDVASLRLWAQRFVEIFPTELSTMRVTIRYDRLRTFREKYGVDWMVVDRRVVGPQLPLVKVYPLGDERNDTYAVYRLPGDPKSREGK
ncbi:DUF6798 domain-containing protein [Aporhodopirellula aestuarii]|uniref:DUF6798 domain-containing protein n=1 Tax=Aporhodopirellula aestuarii TaxID=2950107 RepID=A0ABT0U1Y4_9BACT|nr:DUF6798 domain-containing protein [Aporhodopirellula aestuarii]MCM2370904.1 hypothetical protein [Aporhodopirellula aestuarii]